MRVSLPIIAAGRPPLAASWLASTRPAAWPRRSTNSGVIGNSPTLPRTPSVPKYFLLMCLARVSKRHYHPAPRDLMARLELPALLQIEIAIDHGDRQARRLHIEQTHALPLHTPGERLAVGQIAGGGGIGQGIVVVPDRPLQGLLDDAFAQIR